MGPCDEIHAFFYDLNVYLGTLHEDLQSPLSGRTTRTLHRRPSLVEIVSN